MQQRVRLSLCMIVRDEAESLPRALRSVQGVHQQTVVIDTGSSDDTLAVARRFGAVTGAIPWQDDFAAARNQALALATGEWILVLDADEELTPASRPLLPPLLDAAGVEGYLVQVLSGAPEGADADQCAALRLFRNRPGHRFSGALHEQVAVDAVAASPLVIRHHGYSDEVMQRKGKRQRNLRILQRMVAAEPGNGFARLNLGVELLSSGDGEGALAAVHGALALAEAEAPWRPQAVKYGAIILQQLERWPEAQALLARELPRYPRYTDLYYLNGLALHRLGHPEGAANAWRQCVALGPAPCPPYTTVTPALGGAKAELALGLLHEEQGQILPAMAAYLRALQLCPDWREPLEHCTSLLGQALGEQVGPEQVAAFAAGQPPGGAVFLAGLFARLQRHELALACVQSAFRRGYTGAEGAYLQALCLYRLGRYRETLQLCRQITGVDDIALLALRCACLLQTGDRRAARALARQAPADALGSQLALLLQDEAPARRQALLALLPG